MEHNKIENKQIEKKQFGETNTMQEDENLKRQLSLIFSEIGEEILYL